MEGQVDRVVAVRGTGQGTKRQKQRSAQEVTTYTPRAD